MASFSGCLWQLYWQMNNYTLPGRGERREDAGTISKACCLSVGITPAFHSGSFPYLGAFGRVWWPNNSAFHMGTQFRRRGRLLGKDDEIEKEFSREVNLRFVTCQHPTNFPEDPSVRPRNRRQVVEVNANILVFKTQKEISKKNNNKNLSDTHSLSHIRSEHPRGHPYLAFTLERDTECCLKWNWKCKYYLPWTFLAMPP